MFNFVILSAARGVISMGTKIFNGLPNDLKGVKDFSVFKKKLKSYLLCNVFYFLQEFLTNVDK
jgi:hypothetical protein